MAPREELLTSAVTFLQDPSVASSPLSKRIEFLQSKNLTQEEIDLALARASDDNQQVTQDALAQSQSYAPQPRQVSTYAPRYGPAYGSQYGPYGEWQQPPPELPRRDWRDWFIMATVTSGAAYGLYVLTKRYIAPLIAPPTPPQLEADKAAIDEQFNRAFVLLDTLSADTATLKAAEDARTERLDKALDEVEAVALELRKATQRREDDTRRLNEELKLIKYNIPDALASHKDSTDRRLLELNNELKSVKALMTNRFGGNLPSIQSQLQPQGSGATTPAPDSMRPPVTGPAYQAPPSTQSNNGTATPGSYGVGSLPSPNTGSNAPYAVGNNNGGKVAIPAWQMAASRNNDQGSSDVTTTG